MKELFETPPEPQESSALPAAAVVGVAVAANVWSSFDYAWPAAWGPPQLGLRVRVPFGRGNTPTLGFVVRVGVPQTGRKLKVVADRVDQQPQLDEELLALARWIAEYYLTPLGLVLPAMVPSAVGRRAARSEQVAFLLAGPEAWPGQLGLRQKKVLDELQEARKQGLEGIPVSQLYRHAGGGRETIQRLASRQLIRLERRPVVLANLQSRVQADPFELNPEQQAAAAGIIARLGQGF
jgi:primosomal protein N' (replication factor Y) (superfamily II helicase)